MVTVSRVFISCWMRVVAAASVGALVTVLALPLSVVQAPGAHGAPAHIAGMIVFLDPGHNGANDDSINRQVPTGRGGTKNCQTSGTVTDSGYPEHSFNWETVLRIRAALTQLGVRTALSRGNDDAVGPCIDERAVTANALQPDAIVAIHADGGPAHGRGFHVNYSAPPLNQAQAGPAVQLAQLMRDQLSGSGIPAANYIGSDGLLGREDLAGLNLAQYPAVLVELGNMKNPADSALMESSQGRQKYADAVVRGIVAYLATQPSRAA